MFLNWNLQYHSSAIHDSLVLLSSTEAGLQRALNSFSDAYDTAEMKNENKHGQTEVVHFSRNLDQCLLQVNGATLKQIEKIKYLGVLFTNDGRQDKKLDTPNWQCCAGELCTKSGVAERELSKKAKLSLSKHFLSPFSPIAMNLAWVRLVQFASAKFTVPYCRVTMLPCIFNEQ